MYLSTRHPFVLAYPQPPCVYGLVTTVVGDKAQASSTPFSDTVFNRLHVIVCFVRNTPAFSLLPNSRRLFARLPVSVGFSLARFPSPPLPKHIPY